VVADKDAELAELRIQIESLQAKKAT